MSESRSGFLLRAQDRQDGAGTPPLPTPRGLPPSLPLSRASCRPHIVGRQVFGLAIDHLTQQRGRPRAGSRVGHAPGEDTSECCLADSGTGRVLCVRVCVYVNVGVGVVHAGGWATSLPGRRVRAGAWPAVGALGGLPRVMRMCVGRPDANHSVYILSEVTKGFLVFARPASRDRPSFNVSRPMPNSAQPDCTRPWRDTRR